MRVCIPIPDRQRGGMYTFLRNWHAWLEENGHHVVDDPTGTYDVLFVNSFMVREGIVREARRRLRDLIVVQRVDGSAQDYGRSPKRDVQQGRVSVYSDRVIFQSEYSRFSTREKFKVIVQDGPVIYNPVDLDTFTPAGERRSLPGRIRVCNASFSLNPMKGTWQIGMLAEQNADVDFFLCGRYPELPGLPNIHQLGLLEHDDLAAIMRSCDVFIHLAQNDPCPNVVTEALASGLPVLYVESGGTPELVADCGAPVTVETFRQQLDRVLTADLGEAARARAETHFAPGVIFPQYMNAILNAERQPTPGLFRRLLLRAQGYPVINVGAALERITP